VVKSSKLFKKIIQYYCPKDSHINQYTIHDLKTYNEQEVFKLLGYILKDYPEDNYKTYLGDLDAKILYKLSKLPNMIVYISY